MAVKHFLAAVVATLALAPAALADQPFTVKVDQTVAVKLRAPANSVVIGNAGVADVAVHDATTILITGKSFGTTNVVVLDRAGNSIWSNELAVSGGTDTDLTIVSTDGTRTFSCVDKCRATPMVGDSPKHFEDVMSTITSKSSTAKGGN